MSRTSNRPHMYTHAATLSEIPIAERQRYETEEHKIQILREEFESKLLLETSIKDLRKAALAQPKIAVTRPWQVLKKPEAFYHKWSIDKVNQFRAHTRLAKSKAMDPQNHVKFDFLKPKYFPDDDYWIWDEEMIANRNRMFPNNISIKKAE